MFKLHSQNGQPHMTPDERAKFLKHCKENDGMRYDITPHLPESKYQRGFFEGGVIALWVYLDGNDYTNNDIIKHYRNEAKKEFNGEVIVRNGKTEVMGKSTKGQLNKGFLERVISYLEENYGIKREEVLDPKDYKYWRDLIYSTGEYDHYIDYLKVRRVLK